MRTVLLFNLEDRISFKMILAVSGIKVLELSKEDQEQKTGYLLGKAGFYRENVSCKEPFSDPLIVFDQFSDRQLDEILQLIRNEKVNVSLKAVTTRRNLNWKATALRKELMAEHLAMMNRNKF